MPLDHYGVLAGTLTGHHRDTPDNQGRWYHVHLSVSAGGGSYDCAIDVDSHQSAVGVQWKVLRVPASALGPVPGMADGYHELQHLASAGAIDLIRHPSLVDNPGCLFVRRPPDWLQSLLDSLFPRRPWTTGSYADATTALESILDVGRRTLVWGEPFTQGLGMHNVHQNQGDPVSSQWSAENGIWQDGATMTQRPDGGFDAFVSKFSSQADRTDDQGHPA
ncbi:MAG TPA: DUF2278 family protein [Solirubrobacteraceae bacterium]